MRQLTYTQAATCGENLKSWVTPEQSEKMQLAWFAAGKSWTDDSSEVSDTKNPYLILYADDGLDCCSQKPQFYESAKDMFLSYDHEEIELIDDLPQPDFASQQEVWAWIDKGNKVKHLVQGITAGFKNGKLWYFNLNLPADYSFKDFKNWQKHTPPRLINVNGIEVPAPLDSLEGSGNVFVVDVTTQNKFQCLTKHHAYHQIQDGEFELNICYATKEDAITRAEAMLKFEVVD
jgi:hypothetical protein